MQRMDGPDHWSGSARRRPVAGRSPARRPGRISARRTVHMHACLPASGPHAWMPEPGPFRRGCSPPLRRPGPAGRPARSGLSRFVPLLGRRGRPPNATIPKTPTRHAAPPPGPPPRVRRGYSPRSITEQQLLHLSPSEYPYPPVPRQRT